MHNGSGPGLMLCTADNFIAVLLNHARENFILIAPTADQVPKSSYEEGEGI